LDSGESLLARTPVPASDTAGREGGEVPDGRLQDSAFDAGEIDDVLRRGVTYVPVGELLDCGEADGDVFCQGTEEFKMSDIANLNEEGR
jgi:hypothetical protein